MNSNFNSSKTWAQKPNHFCGHRSTVKSKKLDTNAGNHFNIPNHCITDMILQGNECLGTGPDTVCVSREKTWMRRLRSIQPHGLNIQEENDLFSYFYFSNFLFLFLGLYDLICCLLLFEFVP